MRPEATDASPPASAGGAGRPAGERHAVPTRASIQAWLIARLSAELGVEPSGIDPREPFASYGLSSRQALGLSGDLEDWLARPLAPTVAYDFPTIELLAGHLAMERTAAGVAGGTPQRRSAEPVAIIGIGCRFPGADDPQAFWRLLRAGGDAVSEVPPERWDLAALYDPDPAAPGKMVTRWGGFLAQVDRFEAHFFGIAPREAVCMDPQQRLLLEVAWEALEDAGQPIERLKGSRTGVFVGISSHDYADLQAGDPDRLEAHSGTGNALSVAANRLSYTFGLRGPSLAVDTACSSSLVALHLACQSLANGESTLALVGGVNVMLSPFITIVFSKAGLLAPDGRCKAFDAKANGYVRGEGAGVVVLKPLARALADGDAIHAVIHGTAVNQDGRTNGLTAPSRQAQEEVLREAYAVAGIEPGGVDYVEAHGTGTALGDPIEAAALGAVLNAGRAADRPCAIGSVKTNIGHLEAAAGIAGVIKISLMLRHGEIPASLHFQEPNPHIPLADLGLRVQQSLAPWPRGPGRMVAGVSSYGFGGTNAHAVLGEAPPTATAAARCEAAAAFRPELLALSARSPQALRDLVGSYRDFLADGAPAGVSLRDLCFTAGARRSHHDHRFAQVSRSLAQLGESLAAFPRGEAMTGTSHRGQGEEGRLVFVFGGQGAQWPGMGRELMASEPRFRAVLAQCDELIRELAGWSLLAELAAEDEASRLAETAIAQPAIFAVQAALGALWRSWGVTPAAVVGQSLGEVAAAHLAGVLDLEGAVRLACDRGRIMQRASGGGKMAAVGLPRDEAEAVLAGQGAGLVVAAVNSPRSVVVAGEHVPLGDLGESLRARGIFFRLLPGDYAFHGPQMRELGDELEQALSGLLPRPSTLPFFSTVVGGPIAGERLDAAYWARGVREPILFAPAVAQLIGDGASIFVEVGPHPVLSRALLECLDHHGRDGLVLGSLRRQRGEREALLDALGGLYTAGQPIDWEGFFGAGARCVRLPSYPWQRERCWFEAASPRRWGSPGRPHAEAALHPLLGRRLRSPRLTDTAFEVMLSPEAPAYLASHCIEGTVVVPAAVYLEMGLAAALETTGGDLPEIAGVVFHEPLVLAAGAASTVQIVLSPQPGGEAELEIFSLGEEAGGGQAAWTLHAAARVRAAPTGPAPAGGQDGHPPRTAAGSAQSAPELYARLRSHGLEYGPAFQAIERLWCRRGEVIGELRLPPHPSLQEDGYLLHPVLLDACFQLFAAALSGEDSAESLYLPAGLDSLRVHGPATSRLEVQARLRPRGDGSRGDAVVGDAWVFDDEGRLVTEIRGLLLQRIARGALFRAARRRPDEWLHELAWETRPLVAVAPPMPLRWLILAERGGVGDDLAARLESRGEGCLKVAYGEPPAAVAADLATLDPARPEGFRRLVRETVGKWSPPCGVVHLWSLDAGEPDAAGSSLRAALALGCGSVLHLVQALAESGATGSPPPRLWLVTRGAQAAGPGMPPPAVAQSPLWGLARVIAREHPELRSVLVDLDPVAESAGAVELLAELGAADGEDQVAWRRGQRLVPRLVRIGAPPPVAGDAPRRLEIGVRGVLENLTLRPAQRHPPGRGEVEIRVRAAGLNFRDVLNALGLYPGDAGPLGGECSGEVVAVGPEVEGVAEGDEVVAVAPGCFATFATTAGDLVAAKPPNLTFEQAATIPIAFLTASHALCRLAGMVAGDRVLVHAATGGVGLAAVQLAQRAGAEVFATAGNPEKRALLRTLGVRCVMDSRTLDFAGEVLARTGGEGVDIVLNSLTGESIARSFSVLRSGGRFLEIGKIGIWPPSQAAEMRGDVTYFVVDMAEIFRRDAAAIRPLLDELVQGFRDGVLEPIRLQSFPLSAAEAAFRTMAQAKHIGKIVFTLPRDTPETTASSAGAPVELCGDASYLVTGGLGGLGLLVARWMVERGARHLVLLGRSAPSPAAQLALAAIEAGGVRVAVVAADVADRDQLAAALAEVAATMPPLRGIIHAAGVVDDGALVRQSQERFAAVLAPKVAGAWNLHLLSRGLPLDFFVLFSSASSLLGSPGQGSYAAANAFLDGLAHYRRAHGLPAVSIDWGPWAGVGMTAEVDGPGPRRWAAAGIGTLQPEQGLHLLARLLSAAQAQVAAVAIDDARLGAPPLLARLIPAAGPRRAAAAPAHGELRRRLEAAQPAEVRPLLVAHLQEQVGRVLGLDASHPPDPDQGLFDMGMDSLMAVELKNRLEASLASSLPLTLTFDCPTIAALAEHFAAAFAPAAAGGAATDTAGAADGTGATDERSRLLACIERLAPDEVEALIEKELTSLSEEEGR